MTEGQSSENHSGEVQAAIEAVLRATIATSKQDYLVSVATRIRLAVAAVLERRLDPTPGKDAALEARVAWLERRLERR